MWEQHPKTGHAVSAYILAYSISHLYIVAVDTFSYNKLIITKCFQIYNYWYAKLQMRFVVHNRERNSRELK